MRVIWVGVPIASRVSLIFVRLLGQFMEREAKMRQMAISLARGEMGGDGALPPPPVAEEKLSSSSAPADAKSAKGVDAKADDKGSSTAAASSEAKGGGGGGVVAQAKNTVIIGNVSDNKVAAPTGASRPAWALTETAAAVASEDKLAGDEDDLLNFAASLDFDRYMGDVEVRVMIDGLRKRIVDLEREAANDDNREAAQEERAAKKEMLTKMVRGSFMGHRLISVAVAAVLHTSSPLRFAPRRLKMPWLWARSKKKRARWRRTSRPLVPSWRRKRARTCTPSTRPSPSRP